MLTETDRLGNTVSRTDGAKNELLTEWRYGSYIYSSAAQLSTRYAYDSEGHLRYRVGADGGVTEYRYTAAGALEYAIEYPEHVIAGISLPFPNSAVTEAQQYVR
jgi:YD repeat-containing protein